MPGATIPPRRTDFKTATAKRAYLWRQKQKAKTARAAAAAARQGDAQEPDLVPDESDYDYDSDLSDSGEAQFIRAARSPGEQHHKAPSPVPPGHYRPCDATHPNGNCRLPPVLKPALGCELAANEGRRLFTMHEKALVHGELVRYRERDTPDFAAIAAVLRKRQPAYFGPGTPRMPLGITRQQVRAVHVQGCPEDDGLANKAGQGRHQALPESVVVVILALLASVAKSKVVAFSSRMLQPLVVGVIMAQGFGATLAVERKQGRFCAGQKWLCSIMKQHRWRNVAPAGNARKLPAGWEQLCFDCMLRLAYFVLLYHIPMALVINADHTGLMFLQYKGKGWLPEELWKAGQKAMQHLGDMRQFTLLASTSAAGATLPHQAVFEGKTAGALYYTTYHTIPHYITLYHTVYHTIPGSFPSISGLKYVPSTSKGKGARLFKSESFHEKNSKEKVQVLLLTSYLLLPPLTSPYLSLQDLPLPPLTSPIGGHTLLCAVGPARLCLVHREHVRDAQPLVEPHYVDGLRQGHICALLQSHD